MLFVKLVGETVTWHCGKTFPLTPAEWTNVYSLQADEDELMWILNTIPGIRTQGAKRVQTFQGDEAQKIVQILATYWK